MRCSWAQQRRLLETHNLNHSKQNEINKRKEKTHCVGLRINNIDYNNKNKNMPNETETN